MKTQWAPQRYASVCGKKEYALLPRARSRGHCAFLAKAGSPGEMQSVKGKRMEAKVHRGLSL